MVELQANTWLTRYNTLRLPARSRYFVCATDRTLLLQAVAQARRDELPLLILGGGSNLVLRGDFPGVCVQLATRGITANQWDSDWQWVTAQAGESWHDFVRTCIANGWYGLENLALIPGTVGACPIQNIGAYGVEVKDYIDAVELLDLASGEVRELSGQDCRFGYRDSIFKGELRDQVVILSVRFRLRRTPQLVIGYQGLAEALAGIADPSPQDLFDAVVALRQRKLPDPAQIPNVGSFFKNPVVDRARYRQLLTRHPGLVAYPDAQGMKLAAGWLIDQAGWKGFSDGPVGVHRQQALVLVHTGGGDGAQLLALAARIQADIQRRYGVALEIEPRIYGSPRLPAGLCW